MTSQRDRELSSPRNQTIRAVTLEERRRVLEAVLTEPSLTEVQLAECLAEYENEKSSPDLAEIESIHTELIHVHLPTLKAASLITWDQEENTVEITNHPALNDPRFRRILALDSDRLDTALWGLSHEYRRIVLTVLREEQEPMTRAKLAREIVRRREEVAIPDSGMVERVSISLHHTHFPKLSETNFVSYDFETNRASYTVNSTLEEILRIIYETDQSIVDRFDGFLQGLHDSYPQSGQERDFPAGWPHFWREAHHE